MEEIKNEEQEIKENEEVVENDIDVEKVNARLAEIDARIQEIVLESDKIDIELAKNVDNYELEDHYAELRKEEKALHKEAKLLENLLHPKNQNIKSLDNLSVWILIYGFGVLVLCFPVISVNIWLDLAVDIINLFSDTFSKLTSDSWAYYPILLSITWILPVALEFVSWALKINFCKTKTDKFAFNILWIGQSVLTLAMIIYTIILICVK